MHVKWSSSKKVGLVLVVLRCLKSNYLVWVGDSLLGQSANTLLWVELKEVVFLGEIVKKSQPVADLMAVNIEMTAA